MPTKLFETIYRQALPALEGRNIKDVRIGLGLLAVELDDGALAVSYVLRDELPPGCGVMPIAGPLRGMDAKEMAAWTYDYNNPLLTSLGLAVLNSVVDPEEIKHQSHDDLLTLLQPDDQVGMVGLIGPMVNPIQRITARKLYIFDRSRESSMQVYPETRQKDLLPHCDVVFITGTATINHTLDPLLAYASNAREIILIGTSTPLYPEAFRTTAVTQLAGSLWPKANRDAIFTLVGEGRGIQSLMRYGIKVTIKVPTSK